MSSASPVFGTGGEGSLAPSPPVELEPARRLIIALDVPTPLEAERLVERLGDLPVVFKIGHQLAYTGGLTVAERLAKAGREVFLDLKLHDIPRTVEEGVRSLAGFGARFLTVHAYPQTMRAAVAGANGSGLALLAVTVLTSMNDGDAAEAGYACPVAELARRRAADAVAAGIGGLVCAASEARALREIVGPGRALVVPGIRPAGEAAGDQKRVTTPADAMRAGADLIVVGRPITAAPDPLAAAQAIIAGIAEGAT
ncbi:orotidine-5'-phosphate decarboxylase [Enterovirga aerilata]|uniref:Orotidine 5'-phosphate decarboxylase n=1 Tax=Enterovirga aerilata TaxID=2730920 RepID=A0A849ICT8_9HYPH|nr:orotidine-5'-phosphate decarboxylase [Enterovirga sp. DB1703]NNM75218.1 orotidine-5'-phosphate decarboxylase [Enterovirga sp. DB1703]